jgi:hypothetical protein
MLALVATGNPEHRTVVEAAAHYLVQSQGHAGNGIPETDPRYGAVGAHEGVAPSLETQYLALQALKTASVDLPQAFRDRAAGFITRLQIGLPTDDRATAGSEGGFAQAPARSAEAGAAPVTATATHMAVAALRDLGVPETDPRVQAARHWIAGQYNGSLPATAAASADPFLFYDALVRSMIASGEPVVETPIGATYNWRNDAIRTLLALHRADGSWGVSANSAPYPEADAVLNTARSVNALNGIIHSWR